MLLYLAAADYLSVALCIFMMAMCKRMLNIWLIGSSTWSKTTVYHCILIHV